MNINDIIKQSTKTPILLKRTLDALTPEQREAFTAAFAAEVARMKAVSDKVGLAPLVRPNNARECENLLKRTMRVA